MLVRAARKGHPELADIFRTHGDRLDGLSEQQSKVVAAITACRTAVLGGHVRECDRGCGYEEISYNSCRNRHCPKCQGLERVRWQEARAQDLLPVPYFHLVFTIPSCLHDIFLSKPRLTYNLLFAAAAETLKEVAANPKNLGAEIGMTAVLHTWTQTLLYHPHLHLIVPGGGLDPTRSQWIPTRENFFVSVRILSTVFRAKLLAALENALASGTIASSLRSGVRVAKLLRRAPRRTWVVYAKRPFAGPQQVLAYLGRYTHRIAISNERIVSLDDDQVTFHYRDRTDGDRRKEMTLPALAFLRRFLLHVLPPGFMRIRHYGFLANSIRQKRIQLCRQFLGAPPESAPAASAEGWEDILLRVTGEESGRTQARYRPAYGESLLPAPPRDHAGASFRASTRFPRPPLSSRTAGFPRSGWKRRHVLVPPSQVAQRVKRWRAYAVRGWFAARLVRSVTEGADRALCPGTRP